MDGVAQDLRLNRLDEEVTRSRSHSLDGESRIVGARQNHERGLRTLESKLVEKIQDSRFGVVDIQRDRLGPKTGHESEGVGEASDDDGGVADFLDTAREKVPTLEVAADDENSVGGHKA